MTADRYTITVLLSILMGWTSRQTMPNVQYGAIVVLFVAFVALNMRGLK